jgi:putative FmdB family regulatory protein
MPTYEYACRACGHEWEEIQRISAPPIDVCPACKKVEAQRLISGANFILKGGGWYADLYSSPKPGKANGESKGGESSSKEDSSKGSAKPEAPSSGDTGAKSTTATEPSSKGAAKSEGGPSKATSASAA